MSSDAQGDRKWYEVLITYIRPDQTKEQSGSTTLDKLINDLYMANPAENDKTRGYSLEILSFFSAFNTAVHELWQEERRKIEGSNRCIESVSLFDHRPFILFPTVDFAFPLVDLFMTSLVGYVKLLFLLNKIVRWTASQPVSSTSKKNKKNRKPDEDLKNRNWEESVVTRMVAGQILKVDKFCPVCRRVFFELEFSGERQELGSLKNVIDIIEKDQDLHHLCENKDTPCAQLVKKRPADIEGQAKSMLRSMSKEDRARLVKARMQMMYSKMVLETSWLDSEGQENKERRNRFAVIFDQGYIDRLRRIVIPILYDVLPIVIDYLRNPRFDWSSLDVPVSSIETPSQGKQPHQAMPFVRETASSIEAPSKGNSPTNRGRLQAKRCLVYSRFRDIIEWIIASDALLGLSSEKSDENLQLRHYLATLYSENVYFVIGRAKHIDRNKTGGGIEEEFMEAYDFISQIRKIKKMIRGPLGETFPPKCIKDGFDKSWREFYQRIGMLSTLLRKWSSLISADHIQGKASIANFPIISAVLGLASFEVLQPVPIELEKQPDSTAIRKWQAVERSEAQKKAKQIAVKYQFDLIGKLENIHSIMKQGDPSKHEMNSEWTTALTALWEATLARIGQKLDRYTKKPEAADILMLSNHSDISHVLEMWKCSRDLRDCRRTSVIPVLLKMCQMRMVLNVKNSDYSTNIWRGEDFVHLFSVAHDLASWKAHNQLDLITGSNKMWHFAHDPVISQREGKDFSYGDHATSSMALRYKTLASGNPEDLEKEVIQQAMVDAFSILFDHDWMEFLQNGAIIMPITGNLAVSTDVIRQAFDKSVERFVTTGSDTTSAIDEFTNCIRRIMNGQGLRFFALRMIASILPLCWRRREYAKAVVDFPRVLRGWEGVCTSEVCARFKAFICGDLVDAQEDVDRVFPRGNQEIESDKSSVKQYVMKCPDEYFAQYFEILEKGPDEKSEPGQNESLVSLVAEIEKGLSTMQNLFIQNLSRQQAKNQVGDEKVDAEICKIESKRKILAALIRIGRSAKLMSIVKYVTRKPWTPAEKWIVTPGDETNRKNDNQKSEEKEQMLLELMRDVILYVAEGDTEKLINEYKETGSFTCLDGLPYGILCALWVPDRSRSETDLDLTDTDRYRGTKKRVGRLIQMLRDAVAERKPKPIEKIVAEKKPTEKSETTGEEDRRESWLWTLSLVNLILDGMMLISPAITYETISHTQKQFGFITPTSGIMARNVIERIVRRKVSQGPIMSSQAIVRDAPGV